MNELRCFGCMKLKKGRPECEHCGYDERRPNAPHQLQPGTMLQNQYVVGRVLGQGGFGITYIGWDSFLEIPVCIKEYYPNSVVIRNTAVSSSVFLQDAKGSEQYTNNLKRFAKEARSLAKLGAEERLNNIVRVQNLVQANNTAYIIMEYVAGVDLRGHMQRKGRSLTPRETLEILLPLIQALDKIHAHGIIHRDISPDNIMVLPDGSAKLIDFGASHLSQMDDYGKQKSTEAIVKHGFAPMEQYSRRGHLGPWTDVYAMCATVYYCLTDQVLPPVMDRAFYGEEIDWAIVKGLGQGQLQALKDGLTLDTASRIQSMALLHERLTTAEEPEAETVESVEEKTDLESGIPMEVVQEAAVSAFSATEPVQAEVYTALLTPEEQKNFGIAPTVPVEQDWAQPADIVPTVPVVEEELPDMEPTIAAEEELPVIESTTPVEEVIPVIELPAAEEEEPPVVQESPAEAAEPEISLQEEVPAAEPEDTLSQEESVEVPELAIEAISEVSGEEPEEEREEEIPETSEEEPEPVLEEAQEPTEEHPEEPELLGMTGEESPESLEAAAEPELPQQEEAPVEELSFTEEPGEETCEAPEDESEAEPAEEPEPVIAEAEEPAIAPEAPQEEEPGSAVAVEEEPQDNATSEEPQTPAKTKTRRKGKGKLWLAAVAAVLVCVLGIVLFKISAPGAASPAGKPAAVADPDAWRYNVLAQTYTGMDSTVLSDYENQCIYGTQIRNDQVRSVTFLDTLAEEPGDSWDVSLSQNGSVKAWVRENGDVYDLYIAAWGGINGSHACKRMFAQFTRLEEVRFGTAFHTGEAIEMQGMFYNCHNLQQLDLSRFDTAKIINMRSMFSGCESLTELDLGSFDTANVTDMAYMFQVAEDSASRLETLNVASFDTAMVTDMSGMFSGLDALTALDVTGFDTANVTDMDVMFSRCKSLKALDVSSFHTAQVAGMNLMFRGCESLTSLDLSGFDTIRLTSMSGMFSGCKGLESLDLSNFNTASVKSMGHMFFGCERLKSLDVSSFDTANVTDMQNMFQDCKELESLDLSNFNTASVRYMMRMFHGCKSLTSLNVSSFDTSNVSGMDKMFAGCKSLKSLSLSNFYIASAWPKWDMFKDCQMTNVGHWELSRLLSEARTRSNAWRSNVLMDTYGGLENDTGYWGLGYQVLHGYLKGKTVFGTQIRNDQIRSITFQDSAYGSNRGAGDHDVSAAQNGSVMARLEKNGSLYDLTIFAEGGINAKNCRFRFAEFTNLEEIHFNGAFHTGEATDMTGMFYDCHKLKELDLSDFETGRVTSMHSMFRGCESLTELDLGSFNTAKVTDMTEMFLIPGNRYSSLEYLDLSSFDINNVRNMESMFSGCSKLKDVNHPDFNKLLTAKPAVSAVAAEAAWKENVLMNPYGGMTFYSPSQLLDKTVYSSPLKNWEIRSVTFLDTLLEEPEDSWDVSRSQNGKVKAWTTKNGELYDLYIGAEGGINGAYACKYMFTNMRSLEEVHFGNALHTEQAKDMQWMFFVCESLKELDLSSFDTSNVTNMQGMFNACRSLTNLDVSGFDTSAVTDMAYMFHDCSGLKELDVSGFDTGKVTDMNFMFSTCTGLKTLDLSRFDTSNVADMSSMFQGCKNLTSLDLSHFDTTRLTNTCVMFNGCKNLESLDISSFRNNGVVSTDMFAGCGKLTDVNHPDYNKLLG